MSELHTGPINTLLLCYLKCCDPRSGWMLLWPMKLLHMGQLSPWGRGNRIQVAGLTVLGQRKGLCKGAGEQPVQSEPVHSWASLWWEGGEPKEAEGLVFKEQQPVSNAVLFSCGQISGLIYAKKRAKRHVLLSVKSIFESLFLNQLKSPAWAHLSQTQSL